LAIQDDRVVRYRKKVGNVCSKDSYCSLVSTKTCVKKLALGLGAQRPVTLVKNA